MTFRGQNSGLYPELEDEAAAASRKISFSWNLITVPTPFVTARRTADRMHFHQFEPGFVIVDVKTAANP